MIYKTSLLSIIFISALDSSSQTIEPQCSIDLCDSEVIDKVCTRNAENRVKREINEICDITNSTECVYEDVDLKYLEESASNSLILYVHPNNSAANVTTLVFEASNINIISRKICHNFNQVNNFKILNSRVTYYDEQVFKDCSKLKSVTISYNQIKVIHKKLFGFNAELLEIDMSHNLIEHIEPNELSKNKKLQKLDLSHNKLDYFKLDFTPDTLREINVENNFIKYIDNHLGFRKIDWKIGWNHLHCSRAKEFYFSKVAANELPPRLQVQKIEGLVVSKYQTIECYEDFNVKEITTANLSAPARATAKKRCKTKT